MLRFDRKQQNYVKQLSFNKKIKKKKSYYEISFKLPIFKIFKKHSHRFAKRKFWFLYFLSSD